MPVIPYEDRTPPSHQLAYEILDIHEASINKSDFVEKCKHLCPDTGFLEAIYEIIDLLTIGGK